MCYVVICLRVFHQLLSIFVVLLFETENGKRVSSEVAVMLKI